MVSRVGGSSTSDLRDMREGSFPRSVRETSLPRSMREGSLPRSVREGSLPRSAREGSVGSNDTVDAEDERMRSTSTMSSLGTRSESLASIYSQGEGRYGTVSVRGDIEFGYMYNSTTSSLDIIIKQCKDLAPVDTKRNRSDPYVKVYLLPDRSKGGKRKTKVKKHTLNPVFEEILKFMMPLSEVERRTMWVSVWHSDMFGRNDFLGEVMMPMQGQVFDDPSSKWFTLQDRTEPPEEENPTNTKGDVILALKYVPADSNRKDRKKKGTLMLLVKEAKNIPLTRTNTLPDPYCKCYLLPERGVKQKQKTGVCRRTTSPRWETTITWDDIDLKDINERSVEVSLWDHDRMGQHENLGGVRLNLGSGRQGGKTVTWMDGQGREVTLWRQMIDRQNFWVEGSIPIRQLVEPNRTERQ